MKSHKTFKNSYFDSLVLYKYITHELETVPGESPSDFTHFAELVSNNLAFVTFVQVQLLAEAVDYTILLCDLNLPRTYCILKSWNLAIICFSKYVT